MVREMTQMEKAESGQVRESWWSSTILLSSSSIAPGHFQIDGRLFERVIGR